MTNATLWLALASSEPGDEFRSAKSSRGPRSRDVRSRIPTEDDELIDRIRKGDVAAFKTVFESYWKPLCTIAAIYTHDMAEAEEIVAAIFADLWERRETLRITAKLRTYLHAAVKHRTVNWRRNRSRRAELALLAVPGESPGMGEREAHALASLERQETLRQVIATVNALPDRYRLAFVYRWRYGWEYSDIADVLGVSLDGAKVLVSRALKMIRGRLNDS